MISARLGGSPRGNMVVGGQVEEADDGRVDRPEEGGGGSSDLMDYNDFAAKLRGERAAGFLEAAHGDPIEAARLAQLSFGPSEDESLAAAMGQAASSGDYIIPDVTLSGAGYSGQTTAIVSGGEHWNKNLTSFGALVLDNDSHDTASWRQNDEVTARARAAVADVYREDALLALSGTIGGLAPIAIPYIGGGLGLSGGAAGAFDILGNAFAAAGANVPLERITH
jgi:hypothetical protein